MRTFDDIIIEYLEWLVKKTNDNYYNPNNYLSISLSDQERDLRKAAIWKELIEKCYDTKYGLYYFTKFILGNMMYAGYPTPIYFNKLWFDWSQLAQLYKYLGIKCARQHGKSTMWTVILPLYRMALFEHYNVLISSASEDQAIMLLNFINKLILNNEFLDSKRSKSSKWSTTEIHYNGGKIVAKGVGSEVRGGTYDYCVMDDILRSDNKLSDEDIRNYIDEEVEPMLFVRNGQLVLVGTPKSASDIFTTIAERIEEGALWKLYEYPAILDWDKKKLLCPDRFTWNQLMLKRKNMGIKKFDKEFQCTTYSSGSQLFPPEIVNAARKNGKDYTVYSHSNTEDLKEHTYYMGIDCARAGTASADYTVAIVIAYNTRTQEKRIVWIWRERGMKISEQVKNIANISRNFNNPIILVERNNIGQEFIDMMADEYNLNVESFTTGARGQSKEDLIRSLVVAFENEKIIIPSKTEFAREMTQPLISELDRFVVEITKVGNEIFKGSGHTHDDCIISLALANRCTQSYGYVPFGSSIPKSNTTVLERFVLNDDIRETLNFGIDFNSR